MKVWSATQAHLNKRDELVALVLHKVIELLEIPEPSHDLLPQSLHVLYQKRNHLRGQSADFIKSRRPKYCRWLIHGILHPIMYDAHMYGSLSTETVDGCKPHSYELIIVEAGKYRNQAHLACLLLNGDHWGFSTSMLSVKYYRGK